MIDISNIILSKEILYRLEQIDKFNNSWVNSLRLEQTQLKDLRDASILNSVKFLNSLSKKNY